MHQGDEGARIHRKAAAVSYPLLVDGSMRAENHPPQRGNSSGPADVRVLRLARVAAQQWVRS